MNAFNPDVGCIVLAGGAGRRFGSPKQLAAFRGRPLLEHALAAAAAAPVARVAVVLGANAEAVRDEVDLHGADPVICATWRDGMAESLKAGVAGLGEAEAVVVMLGDQPLVSAEAVRRVVASREAGTQAVRATYAGVPGHPVVLERALFGEVAALEGDVGARAILESASVREVACDDVGDPADVDSPADLRALEARAREG